MYKTLMKLMIACIFLAGGSVAVAAPWEVGYSEGEDYVQAADVTGKVMFVLSCDGLTTSYARLLSAKNKPIASNYRVAGSKLLNVIINGVVYIEPFSAEVYNTPQKYAAFYNEFRNATTLEMAVDGRTYKFNTDGLKQALPPVDSPDFKCTLQ